MPTEPEEKFEMWAKVDLFGHNQRVGKLSVVNTGVEVLYRLDSPHGDEFVTEYFGKGAVYSILPCSEDAARLMAKRMGSPAPISTWDLPEEWRNAIRALKEKALPAPKETGGDFESERTYAERMEEYLNDETPEDEEGEDEEFEPEPPMSEEELADAMVEDMVHGEIDPADIASWEAAHANNDMAPKQPYTDEMIPREE